MDRQAFGIHMEYRETFLQIHMLPLQLLMLKKETTIEKSLHMFTAEKSERPE